MRSELAPTYHINCELFLEESNETDGCAVCL